MIKPVKRSERVPIKKWMCWQNMALIIYRIIGGDLPRTRSGNRYILAVICNVSKWPTIIPLKDLKAETVAEKLLELFSFSGLPRVINHITSPASGRLDDSLENKTWHRRKVFGTGSPHLSRKRGETERYSRKCSEKNAD